MTVNDFKACLLFGNCFAYLRAVAVALHCIITYRNVFNIKHNHFNNVQFLYLKINNNKHHYHCIVNTIVNLFVFYSLVSQLEINVLPN